MAIPMGINMSDVSAAKLHANNILRIADEINSEIFSQTDKNQEALFQAWQSENAEVASASYEEMRKSFEKYYNYLKETFDWINEATDQVTTADTEVAKTYVDTNQV